MLHRCSCLAALAVVLACGEARQASPDVPVKVGWVALDERVGSPVVVLEESNGSRTLPIWIGLAEARSIAAEMEHQRPPRPNTHDLATRLITGLRATVERVVVTELRSGIYYANLVLGSNGREIAIDSRPSDAIAIGLRTKAPIYAHESLLDPRLRDPDSPAGREARHRLPLPDGPGWSDTARAIPASLLANPPWR